MGVITVQDLKPGMITAAPVKTKAGQLIIGINRIIDHAYVFLQYSKRVCY